MGQKKSPDRHRGRLLYNAHEKKNKVDAAKLTAKHYIKLSNKDERSHFRSNGK
jgi:hypothetical protein